MAWSVWEWLEVSCSEVMRFVLCLMVALAWKNFVPSSPNFTHFIIPLCFQYIFYCCDSEDNLSMRRAPKFHSGTERSLNSYKIPKKARTNITFEILVFRLDSCACHDFKTPLRFLNLAVIILALSEWDVGIDHPWVPKDSKSKPSSNWRTIKKQMHHGLFNSILAKHAIVSLL